MQLRKTQTLTKQEIDVASATPLLPALRRRNNSLIIGDEMLGQYLSGDTQVRGKEGRVRGHDHCQKSPGFRVWYVCARVYIRAKGV